MTTSLNFNGIEFEINDTGVLTAKDGKSGSVGTSGKVGLMVHSYPVMLDPSSSTIVSAGQPTTPVQLFLKPDEARLLASALMSAATSVQSKQGLR